MSADLSPYALDPFGPSANPGAYVACEASERARAALERSLDQGRVAAVVGPPGHGKTLLLRLLGGREEERARVAYVPFCTLEVDELFALVLNALGIARPGPPRDVLLALARELAARGGIVILVDDANAMSDECAAALVELLREAQGALRIGLAAVQGSQAQRVFRAFGSEIDVVQLADGMSGREARRYVETRLAYGGARPELVAAFDDDTIEKLHRASEGIPRRLNQVAQDVVRHATRGAIPRLGSTSAVQPSPATSAPAIPARPAAARAPLTPAPVPQAPPAPRPPAAPPTPPPATTAPRKTPPTARPTARRVLPRPLAPVPPPRAAAPSQTDLDDDRGILLPEIFDRAPGEPGGEYRVVRGRFVESAAGRAGESDAGAPIGVRPQETMLVVRPPERVRRHAAPPRPSQYARRVETAQPVVGARLPIRLIGIAGFALGVALALYWMMMRETPAAPIALAPPATTAAVPQNPSAVAPPDSPVAPEPSPTFRGKRSDPFAPAAEFARKRPAPAAPVRVSVSINATPWAIVRVDGRELGETPMAGVELAPGPHLFEARMPDGSTREQRIEITLDRATVVFE